MTKAKQIKYRSGFERTVHEAVKKSGKTVEYESFSIPYTLSCTYTPDFTLPNGIIVETKGRLTSPDRRKMLAVKRTNPSLDIRFVFQRANIPIRKGSKTRYWEWAERHNFPWAESKIPLEWFKERKK